VCVCVRERERERERESVCVCVLKLEAPRGFFFGKCDAASIWFDSLEKN